MYTKTPRTNYSTHFDHQNETSNNKIHQEHFNELRRKCGANCNYKVFRNAPGSFRFSAGGAGWGREK